MNELKYQLNERVKIRASEEEGEIVGRAEYSNCDPSYFVRYKAADGRAVEQWWTQDAITNGND